MSNELYPLTLEPSIADQFWTRPTSSTFSAESGPGEFSQGTMWMATVNSRVAAGPQAGRSLGQLKHLWGAELVGSIAGGDPDYPLPVELKLKRTGDMALAVALSADSLWYMLAADENSSVNAGFREDLDFRGAAAEADGQPGVWSEFMTEYSVEAGQCLYLPRRTPLLLGAGLTVAQISPPARTLPNWPLSGTDEDALRQAQETRPPVWLTPKALGPGQGEIFNDSGLTVRLIVVSHFSSVVSSEAATFLWPLFGQGRIRARGPAPATRLSPGRAVMLPAALGRYAIESGGTVGFLMIEARQLAEVENV
jgi:hypothetical protein